MRRLTIVAAAFIALGCLPTTVGATGAPVITTPTNGAMVPGASNVTIGGTGTPNASVSVIDSGTSTLMGSSTANSAGQWTLVRQLADGEYTVHAIEAGSAPSSSVTFEVDAVRPLAPDVDHPSNGQIFGPGQNAVIDGTALDDTGVLAVQLEFWLLNNLKKRVNADCTCGGTTAAWSYTFNPDVPGYYVLKAAAYDSAGNRSDVTTVSFFDSGVRGGPVIEPVNPKLPQVPKPPVIWTPEPHQILPGDDSGEEEQVGGVAPPGTRVQVIETNAGLGTINNWRTTVADRRTGVWTVEHDFGDGVYTLRARAIDSRGRVSPLSTRVTFIVDAARPNLIIETESDDLPMTFLPTQPIELSGLVNDNRGLLAVQLDYWYLDKLVLRQNAVCECSRRTQALWVDRPALELPGYYHVQVKAIDQAGNRSTTQVVTFLKAA